MPPLPNIAAYKPTRRPHPTYHPTPPAVGSVPTQEPGVRPSRRLGYRFHVEFAGRDPATSRSRSTTTARSAIHLQARSLTVAGAPYSYTIGAGDELTAQLPNPGTYDLSVHGPNGFFRHFAGSPETVLRVEVQRRPRGRPATVRSPRPPRLPAVIQSRSSVNVADAYGRDRQIRLRGTSEITIDTRTPAGGTTSR